MGKLYLRTRAGIRYGEAWVFGKKVLLHEGKLRERGKVKQMDPRPGEPTRQILIESFTTSPCGHEGITRF